MPTSFPTPVAGRATNVPVLRDRRWSIDQPNVQFIHVLCFIVPTLSKSHPPPHRIPLEVKPVLHRMLRHIEAIETPPLPSPTFSLQTSI
jgi:hypothetical protein